MSVVSALGLVMLLQTPPPPVPPVPPPSPFGAAQTQTQSRDQAPRPPTVGKSSLSGIVMSENGQPLKGARVTLSGAIGRSVLTDGGGTFVFDKLPEGRYTLTANRARYLSSSYGQKRPERSGTPVLLGDSEQLKNLKITLFSAGVITGTVYSDDGEPVQGAQVRALRYVMNSGVRRLQNANTVQTDDRGMYRIFGLTPGDYIVTASSNQGVNVDQISAEMQLAIEKASAAAASSGAPLNVKIANGVLTLPGGQTMEAPAPVTFAPTYYPGTVTPAGAVTLTVRGGEDRSGVDISLMKVQTANISGMVTAGGPLPQNVTITMQSADEAGQSVNLPSARVDADGRFSLRSVPPGSYLLTARATTTERRVIPAGGSIPQGVQVQSIDNSQGQQVIQMIQTTSTGRAMVNVDGQPLNGVVIALDAGRTLTGRVMFDGMPPPDPTRLRMVATLTPVQSAQSLNTPSPQPGEVAADGTFKITGIAPGRYTLRMSAALGWTLRSSVIGGRDTLDFPFDVDANDIHGAVVTMAFMPPSSELTGLLTDQLGKPVSDYSILVFSADQRFWAPGSRRIMATRPDTDGKYVLRGMPAGDYQIAALSDLEPGMQYDPEFLKSLLVASVHVTVGPGGKVTQDLRISGS